MRKTFIFYADWIDYTEEMSLDEKWLFLQTILNYQNWKDLWNIDKIKFVWTRVKKLLDEANQKWDEEIEKRKQAWKLGWIAKASKAKQKLARASKWQQLLADTVTVTDTVTDNINKEILPDGNNSGAEILPVYVPEDITIQINELIKEIKQTAQTLWIAYDKTKEREFAKHLLTAIEYGKFCENVWMDRQLVAIQIMRASVIKNYRRWPTAWPKSIYQNYAEVYNLSKTDKNKTIDLTSHLTNGKWNKGL